jgi:hypothetical protein
MREDQGLPYSAKLAVGKRVFSSKARNSSDLICGCHHYLLLSRDKGAREQICDLSKTTGQRSDSNPTPCGCPALRCLSTTTRCPRFLFALPEFPPLLSVSKNLHYITTLMIVQGLKLIKSQFSDAHPCVRKAEVGSPWQTTP